jgi:phage-related protein (TIGR01555 family)
MAFITDNLRAALQGIGAHLGIGRAPQAASLGIFGHQLALAAYMSSGMLRKVIAIPADDRVREWRDWQADKEQIELIEAEEKRLQVQAKFRFAEQLRGMGGGALILITAGNHAEPLKPETIAKGGLVAINVVSRWQISGKDWVTDLADPLYGTPRMFQLSGGTTANRDIHPSRVICFRGDPIPMGGAVATEEAFWGDSRLLRVFTEVRRSDETQAWFAALVKKAKLLRFGIPDLDQMDMETLSKRVAVIAEGENSLNATLFRSSGRDGDSGETITDYQITWNGIPAVMDAFDQRVAAVADIPFTRLMGRSPAGMNATGQHDTDNWNRSVASGQKLETQPCLEQLDPILIRSAGVADPSKVWWVWAPLDTPTEKEVADTFKTLTEAINNLINSGIVPHEALARAVQNLLEEKGYLPGLSEALAKLSEEERFGLAQGEDDGTDPSGLQSGNGAEGGDPTSAGGGNGSSGPPARRAANDAATWMTDATPRPTYVQRKLLNASALIAWAKANGFESTLPADDMHVTVLYSRQPVDPMKMGRDWREDEKGQITVRPGGPRSIERLGENAVVLRFACPDLDWRHRDMIEAGGSHDYDEYQPHVTLSYSVPADVDVEAIQPFQGALVFGPELFEPLNLDWKSGVVEE